MSGPADRTDAVTAADPVERAGGGRRRSGDRAPGSGPDTTRATLRVVMVDDEEALCLGVRRIVGRYRFHLPEVDVEVGYEFDHFQSGEAFLAALAEGAEYDLLLLDLKLPGINGLDVLTEVTEQGRELLTLFITAYATFETAVKATKLGAYDFLPKPFSPDELRYGLRKASSQLILSRQARKLAAEARQIRFNFISVLAHELKSPINAVEGYLNILRDDVPDGDRRMVDRSLVRLDGMKKLIFDLLDVTRIESGQKQRRFADVDVRRHRRGGDRARRTRRRRQAGDHLPRRARSRAAARRPRRDRDHRQQPRLERGQVQPRRRQRRRGVCAARASS